MGIQAKSGIYEYINRRIFDDNQLLKRFIKKKFGYGRVQYIPISFHELSKR